MELRDAKDAARYRWLRDECKWVDIRAELGWQAFMVNGSIDDAIDAAMAPSAHPPER